MAHTKTILMTNLIYNFDTKIYLGNNMCSIVSGKLKH